MYSLVSVPYGYTRNHKPREVRRIGHLELERKVGKLAPELSLLAIKALIEYAAPLGLLAFLETSFGACRADLELHSPCILLV